MSDIDLTEAVDAAARAFFNGRTPAYDDLTPGGRHSVREVILPAVVAVAPLIEAAVREKVAAEIEASHLRKVGFLTDAGIWANAASNAAMIARYGADS